LYQYYTLPDVASPNIYKKGPGADLDEVPEVKFFSRRQITIDLLVRALKNALSCTKSENNKELFQQLLIIAIHDPVRRYNVNPLHETRTMHGQRYFETSIFGRWS
jgi:hypothetical protein